MKKKATNGVIYLLIFLIIFVVVFIKAGIRAQKKHHYTSQNKEELFRQMDRELGTRPVRP